MCVQRVHVPTEHPILHATVGGWEGSPTAFYFTLIYFQMLLFVVLCLLSSSPGGGDGAKIRRSPQDRNDGDGLDALR